MPTPTSVPEKPDAVAIGDWDRWGRLVMTWATGVNHLADGQTYRPPHSLSDLRRQAELAGCQLTIPAKIKKLHVIQENDDTLVLTLPPKSMVDAYTTYLTELGSQAGGAVYPLPPFYGNSWGASYKMTTAQLLAMQAARVGEYTINNCQ
ncbi:MAG TPA: hypothetical protein VFA03_16200 [Acetobacteraceae bacterium]|nr:hypothetical protein [Acetobacteraceae bacterium]